MAAARRRAGEMRRLEPFWIVFDRFTQHVQTLDRHRS